MIATQRYESRNIHVCLHLGCSLCPTRVSTLEWVWSLAKTAVNTYCKMLSKCSFRGVITQLSNDFVTSNYKMIFKQDPPYMSMAAMEALIDIADWNYSPSDTFIWMYTAKKPPHVLPKFALYKLVMHEVSYHISA